MFSYFGCPTFAYSIFADPTFADRLSFRNSNERIIFDRITLIRFTDPIK
jgi:hypothetical protein